MPATWNRNRLTEKLGIDYSIVQGPLGGLSSQRLTAAVSNFGGWRCAAAQAEAEHPLHNDLTGCCCHGLSGEQR